jgi:hypothetical protein
MPSLGKKRAVNGKGTAQKTLVFRFYACVEAYRNIMPEKVRISLNFLLPADLLFDAHCNFKQRRQYEESRCPYS